MIRVYEVKYLDSKYGSQVLTTTVEAEDEGEALEIAMDDYYFGSLISITEEGG